MDQQHNNKSKLAFDSIRFLGFDEADRDRYYPVKKVRTEQAGRDFQKICEEDADGLYMIDIMRAGLTNADARIPRSKPVQMSKN